MLPAPLHAVTPGSYDGMRPENGPRSDLTVALSGAISDRASKTEERCRLTSGAPRWGSKEKENHEGLRSGGGVAARRDFTPGFARAPCQGGSVSHGRARGASEA